MRILGGEKKGMTLTTRRGHGTRPLSARVKTSLFGILEPFLGDAHFFDFFAGNGAVGLEALSRGAGKASFYEKDGLCVRIIKENIRQCGLGNCTVVHRCDVLKIIPRLDTESRKPAVIFLGPPYGHGLAHQSLQLLAERDPFRKDSLIIAETRKKEPLEEGYGRYICTREKLYGDTRLSFYQRRSETGEETVSK